MIEIPNMNADEYQVSGNHYKDLDVQPWVVMKALLTPEEFQGYLKGCIIKYGMRQGRKEGSDDGGKCLHYIHKRNEKQSERTHHETPILSPQ